MILTAYHPRKLHQLNYFLFLAACSRQEEFCTLYRNSVMDESMRIHIATFNEVTGGYKYNIENCQLASVATLWIGINAKH